MDYPVLPNETVEYLYYLQPIIAAYKEYQEITQQKRAERFEIEAWEKVTLAEIKAKRDVLIGYLDRSFDERAKNFEGLFQSVDRAVASGNNQQLGLLLHAIVELARTNPFKDIHDLSAVQAALNDPDHVWEL